MSNELDIVYVDQPGQAEWSTIGGGIGAFNEQQTGGGSSQYICYVLRSSGEEIVGGVIAATHWDWLYVDLMWIKEEFRGQGYGRRLLALAEDKAREQGAKNAYLDTFTFQAPGFYEKHGYQVFGELAEFPTGHRRYYLTKEL